MFLRTAETGAVDSELHHRLVITIERFARIAAATEALATASRALDRKALAFFRWPLCVAPARQPLRLSTPVTARTLRKSRRLAIFGS
jgi:hypothetical protein